MFNTWKGQPASCVGESLALNSINLEVSLDGTFGLGASATLGMPQPATTPAVQEEIPFTAEISIDLTIPTAPAINAALYTTGPMVNAFGISGLTLGDVAIQGGIVFNPPPAPPTPSIGFAATITSLPASWAKAIGYTNDGEPLTFALNISESSPVFALQLGIPDRSPVLEFGSALQVDDASLILAPLGGTVGPYTYAPGVSMQFDGKFISVPVSVQAAVNLTAASVTAAISVGTVAIGPLTFSNTMFNLAASPTSFDLKFTGGVSSGLGGPTLNGTAESAASLTSAPCLSVSASTSSLTLDNQLALQQFTIGAQGSFGGGPVGPVAPAPRSRPCPRSSSKRQVTPPCSVLL